MSVIISKREFLKGLFAAPAIVAVSSIMPIKATADNIFTLEKFAEVPSYSAWSLIREHGGNHAWMKESDISRFINDVDIIRQVKIPEQNLYDFKGNLKLTVELMRIHSCQVVHELPAHFTRSLIGL